MTSTGRPLRNADVLPRIPAASPTEAGSPARAFGPARLLEDCVSGAWAVAGGLGWLLLFGAALAIQPQPSDPAAVPSPIDALFTSLLALALSATAFGLAARRRAGFAASLAGAGVFLAAVLLCPVSGHHELAPWWYGQLACAGGLVALSLAGLLWAGTGGRPGRAARAWL